MKLYYASKLAVKIALKKFHYMERLTQNWVSFSVFEEVGNEEVFCGVIVYGYDVNPNVHKQYNSQRGRIIQLLRVALNGKQSSTSKAVSISLRLLKKLKPCIHLVVSFADEEAGHLGTLYQATNFYYLGSITNQKRYFDVKKGIYAHTRNLKGNREYIKEKVKDKHKYLFPFTEEMRKYCEDKKLEYPKKEKLMRG